MIIVFFIVTKFNLLLSLFGGYGYLRLTEEDPPPELLLPPE